MSSRNNILYSILYQWTFIFNAYSQNSNLVFLPGDKPYNQNFNKWVEEWFNWFLSIADINGGHPKIVIHLKNVRGIDLWVQYGTLLMR